MTGQVVMNINDLIDRALKITKPSLVFKNANIVNVFTHESINGDVAIQDGIIVGIGDYDGIENIDLENKYIAPGLIDAHVHIESSKIGRAHV